MEQCVLNEVVMKTKGGEQDTTVKQRVTCAPPRHGLYFA